MVGWAFWRSKQEWKDKDGWSVTKCDQSIYLVRIHRAAWKQRFHPLHRNVPVDAKFLTGSKKWTLQGFWSPTSGMWFVLNSSGWGSRSLKDENGSLGGPQPEHRACDSDCWAAVECQWWLGGACGPTLWDAYSEASKTSPWTWLSDREAVTMDVLQQVAQEPCPVPNLENYR